MNENAISNILIDVDFLEDAFKRIGRPHLSSFFIELRLVCLNFRLEIDLTRACTCRRLQLYFPTLSRNI
jgi:hypothetical protein